MDSSSALYFASFRQDLPTLDLHGLYPSEALEKLEHFLYTIYQAGEREARVICGIGTGKLLEAVAARLQTHPLVRDLEKEGGSCIIRIENKK